jgi:hypothetical protein
VEIDVYAQARALGIQSSSLPYSGVRLESCVRIRFARFNRKAEQGGRESSYSRHDLATRDAFRGRLDGMGWRKSVESDP